MTTLCSSERPSLPSFIRKIFQILNTPEYGHIICWDKDGKSIKIFDFKELEEDVLELEFRHKNHRSFIRQLNMYGFKKMRKSTTTTIYFFHPLFTRDGEENLHMIERKRENKRRLKLELLGESFGDESKDEEFRKMKKRNAVLRFLGMEKPNSPEVQEGSFPESKSSSSLEIDQKQKISRVLVNPTNAIKERKTSINVVSSDPPKNNILQHQISKRSFDIQTASSLRKQETCFSDLTLDKERKYSQIKTCDQSKGFEALSLKSQFSSASQMKPKMQIQNKGFSAFQTPQTSQTLTFNSNTQKIIPQMQMFPFNPFVQCMFQVPQFSMYPQPMYFAPPAHFQCFTLPQ